MRFYALLFEAAQNHTKVILFPVHVKLLKVNMAKCENIKNS